MTINTTVPMQKSIRFFMMMLPALFARVKPVSTIAKPPCIKNTSAAPIRNQTGNTTPFTASRISVIENSLLKINKLNTKDRH